MINVNNKIVILYKKIGKEAEFKKVENELESFKNLLGEEIEYIPYEDITIIAKKNRKNLKPNIYINTKFLSIGESIRGEIIITCKENEKFKTLTKEQAMRYKEFLNNASFNYDNFEKYIFKSKANHFMNQKKYITEKEIEGNNTILTNYNSKENIKTGQTLKMILDIQSIILKYIKNNEN